MRIKLINPNTTWSMTEKIGACARSVARPGTEIVVPHYELRVGGSVISGNHANEGGGAIFFVSNNRTGTMSIDHSTLKRNPSDRFETAGLPGIFFLGAHAPRVRHSIIR